MLKSREYWLDDGRLQIVDQAFTLFNKDLIYCTRLNCLSHSYTTCPPSVLLQDIWQLFWDLWLKNGYQLPLKMCWLDTYQLHNTIPSKDHPTGCFFVDFFSVVVASDLSANERLTFIFGDKQIKHKSDVPMCWNQIGFFNDFSNLSLVAFKVISWFESYIRVTTAHLSKLPILSILKICTPIHIFFIHVRMHECA